MESNDFLEKLRSEGRLVTRGDFELDRAKAREKLAEFQLANPHHYVLELVAAGHLLGADPILIWVDADELEIEFARVGLSAEELADLYNQAFSERTDDRSRGLWHLALGLVSADALEPSVERIESYRDGELCALTRRDGEETFTRTEDEQVRRVTRIYLREKLRPAHFREFFEYLAGSLPESVVLRDRCRYSPRTILLDGKRISHGHQLVDEAANRLEFETANEHGVVGVVPTSDEVVVDIIQSGVRVHEHRRQARLVGIHAVIETRRLSRDLSRDKFVEDDSWRDFIDEVVPAAVYAALYDFLPPFLETRWSLWDKEEWLRRLTLEVVHGMQGVDMRLRRFHWTRLGLGELPDAQPDLAEMLCAMPLWEQVPFYIVEKLPFSEILERTRTRRLQYSKRMYIDPPGGDDIITLHLPDGPPELLEEVIDSPLVDVTSRAPRSPGGDS